MGGKRKLVDHAADLHHARGRHRRVRRPAGGAAAVDVEHQLGHEIDETARAAGATQRKDLGEPRIRAGHHRVVLLPAKRDQVAVVVEFATALLDGAHGGAVGEGGNGRQVDAFAGKLREIVEHHREIDRLGDVQEVREDVLLRHREEARRHEGDGGEAERLGETAELDRGAGAGDR